MAEKIDAVEKMIKDHEKRISKLEKATFGEKLKLKGKQEFRGLSGGIQYLISKGFLNTPKSVNEVQEELRKEGYHYRWESINKMLSIDFMRKRKLLRRIKENGIWKYVARK